VPDLLRRCGEGRVSKAKTACSCHADMPLWPRQPDFSMCGFHVWRPCVHTSIIDMPFPPLHTADTLQFSAAVTDCASTALRTSSGTRWQQHRSFHAILILSSSTRGNPRPPWPCEANPEKPATTLNVQKAAAIASRVSALASLAAALASRVRALVSRAAARRVSITHDGAQERRHGAPSRDGECKNSEGLLVSQDRAGCTCSVEALSSDCAGV
jgi:hypothetical protein